MTPEELKKLLAELKRAGMTQGITNRAIGMRVKPGTYDAKKRTVRFVAATEKSALVFDWERWDFVDEVLRMDGMIVPDGGSVRLLDTHSRASVRDILGSAADFQACEIDGQEARDCEVSFSDVQDGRDAAQKVEEGHITDVSVGYEVKEAFYVPESEKQIINGKEYEGPVKVSTSWELRELSLVPIGADSLAKVRSMVGTQKTKGEVDVNEKLRLFLESRGLAKDATDEQALEFMRDLVAKSDEARAEVERLKSDGPTPPPADSPDLDHVRAEAQAAERTRINDITEAVSVAGLDAEFGRGLIDQGMPIDAARAEIFKKMKEGNPPVGAGTGRMEVGLEAGEKFRAAATDGLLLRTGLAVEQPAPGHREFRGMSLKAIARESLSLAGVHVRGLSSQELVSRALSPASSSDFPALMAAVSNRHLLAAYGEAPATWRPFVAVTGATDFRDIYGVSLSGSPDLMDLDENGEYKTANFSDKQESYRVISKGRKIKLTRVMIINDDLRAFTRIPMLFGAAARRMEADAVYSLITSNPTMADGVTLFHADHNNLEAVDKTPVDSDNLSLGRTAMRSQTGMAGEALDLVPAFLLASLEQETAADILLLSAALPTAEMSSGVKNPWAGKLTPITDSRLSDDSATAWYLVASPNQAPVIEVAYLEGEEQPFIDDEVEFSSDSLIIKVRHDFGAGLMDHRGIFKNPGA